MTFQDTLTGLLVTNNEGRPTKIEGNPDHPSSQGRTSIYNQASILELYDPDRSRSARHNGDSVSIYEFYDFLVNHFENRDRSVLFVDEQSSSPTYHRLKGEIVNTFANAEWVSYEIGRASCRERAQTL